MPSHARERETERMCQAAGREAVPPAAVFRASAVNDKP
jgi:hypothetical protein